MYERFTDRARKVMQLANQEALRFNHEYIGTEHVLLGLIKEGSGVAAHTLKNMDVDLRKIRLEVEKLVQSGPDMVISGKLPQTPRAKKVIEYAMQEARDLNHNYVGTEHILLGLMREQEGVAAQILMNLGLKLEEVRAEVLNLLGHGIEGAEGRTESGSRNLGAWRPAEELSGEKARVPMFDQFTERARKVFQLSNQEGQRFNHEYIGTEHLLLALVKEGSGVAASVLANLGVDLRRIRLEVEKLIQSRPDLNIMGHLPMTRPAKKVIEFAVMEAQSLHHGYFGTEHLLLGLLREGDGVAAQVLTNLGPKLEEVRSEVLNMLKADSESGKWTQRGAGPLPRQDAEKRERTNIPRFQGTSRPLQKYVEARRGRPSFTAKEFAHLLSWIFLALGSASLAMGVTRDASLTLPGAVLVGASIIAIALHRR
jgi:ATP-dependent Clp protease ATP-binding subunit ClpA